MKKDLVDRGKKLIYWYSKENSLCLLPFIFSNLLLWILLANISNIFLKKKGEKNKVVAFTSLYYNGNARAVYEYMRKNEDYVCYWIARNRKSFLDVKRSGGHVIYCYFPFLGIKYILNTDVIVTNDSFLSILFPYKPKMIQLWHGEGPKGITPSYEECDVWCVPSEFIKDRHIKLWKAPAKKLKICGSPRLDMLNNYLRQPKEKLLKELNIKNGRKIILYAPTFDVGLWPWGDQYKGFEELCEFCKENNLILILRLHPLAKVNKMRIKRILKRYNNVYWLDMPIEPNTMKLLAVADILITDWSSIYTDFFLTQRPIAYMEIEPDYYLKDRGKSQVPPEFRAGEISKSSKEFFKGLRSILKKGNCHSEEQKRLFKIIYGNIDGKASERVASIIRQIVNQ